MKFRAWDMKNKKMLSWEEIRHLPAESLFSDVSFKRLIPLRCTGERDACGTEVYEGDIIEDAAGRKFEVKYGKYWSYCPESKCKIDSVGFYLKAPGLPKMPIGPLEDYAKVIAVWDRVD